VISVITTLYNYRNYIQECIESYLSQEFPESEMIIVDDASTDNPYEIIKPFVGEKVRYIRLEENGGYSHAKNVGIRNAKWEILAMLDADDMLTDGSLRRRYDKISEGFDFVHGPALNLKDNKISSSKLWKEWMASKKRPEHYRLVHAQSAMLRKDIHRKIGLYDESLRCKSDREMWARIFYYRFQVGWITEPVAIYRVHPKQMHKSKWKAKNNDKLQKQVLKKIARRRKDLSDCNFLE